MHGKKTTIPDKGSHKPLKRGGEFVQLYDPNSKTQLRFRKRNDRKTVPPCGNNTRGRGNHKSRRKQKQNHRKVV